MRVLIADNSSVIRGRILKLITNLKLKNIELIKQSTNVPQTIEIYYEFKPNVIILDYKLIGGNSMDLLEILKKENSKPVVIILADTAYKEIKRQCLHAGANYVFDKSDKFGKINDVLKQVN